MKKVKVAICSSYYSWLASALLGLLIIQITGCASVPEGSAAMKQQALRFSPPNGMAAIYIIRPYHFMGSGVLYKFSLDDYVFDSSLKTESYVFGVVPPGFHKLCFPLPCTEAPHLVEDYIEPAPSPGFVIKHYHLVPRTYNANTDTITSFTAEAGRNYFFLVNCGAAKMQISQLSEAEGEALVAKFELSGDSRFGHQTPTGITQ